MAAGKGKYDDLCSEVRQKSGGSGAIVIIFEGTRGFGFSVQAAPEVIINIPNILDIVSSQIREDMKKGIPVDAIFTDWPPMDHPRSP